MRRLLITVVVVGALAFGGDRLWQLLSRPFGDLLNSPSCTAAAQGASFSRDPEQTGNAAIIAAVADQMQLKPHLVTIALATAMQESKLYNLSGGDRDSLGLFQQRPSMGWGTAKQIMDPAYASKAFYDALLKLPGASNESTPVGVLAQAVQHSADGSQGASYTQHESEARAFASALSGESPHGLTCQIDKPKTSNPTAAASDISTYYGRYVGTPISRGNQTTYPLTGSITQGWAVSAYLVAKAQQYGILQVSFSSWTWTTDRGWQQSGTGSPGVEVLFAG